LEQKIILGDDLRGIINMLETKMCKQYNKVKILRLICLLSVTQSGLKQVDLDNIRKTYIQCYGYDEIPTLMNMQDAGLLKLKDKKLNWANLKKSFKLVNEEVNPHSP
jgi:hypothetical protein